MSSRLSAYLCLPPCLVCLSAYVPACLSFRRSVYMYFHLYFGRSVCISVGLAFHQEHEENRKRLDDEFNGTKGLAKGLRVDLQFGLAMDQVEGLREAYGPNSFPEIPMKSFCTLFVESFNDTILLVLIAAAVVSLIIGIIEEPASVSG